MEACVYAKQNQFRCRASSALMALRSSYRSPSQIALFALLVFAGSVFSLILGTAIPRTIVKLKNRRWAQEIAETPFKRGIFIRSYHDKKYRVDISSVEFITFVTAFLIALGFAINLHFDEMMPVLSFKDWVTPFLWGFGLDQGKSTFMESSKSLAQGAGKVE
jgi:hypothetical protein